MTPFVHISSQPLSVNRVMQMVTNPACGAIDIFVGTVRNQTKGKGVIRLEFEAYESMAVKEMEKIRQQVCSKWPTE
ncbi:MAG: molybdenum cofactor biosynthesis protein MoaE, partial [Bacteroidota bacterium]